MCGGDAAANCQGGRRRATHLCISTVWTPFRYFGAGGCIGGRNVEVVRVWPTGVCGLRRVRSLYACLYACMLFDDHLEGCSR